MLALVLLLSAAFSYNIYAFPAEKPAKLVLELPVTCDEPGFYLPVQWMSFGPMSNICKVKEVVDIDGRKLRFRLNSSFLEFETGRRVNCGDYYAVNITCELEDGNPVFFEDYAYLVSPFSGNKHIAIVPDGWKFIDQIDENYAILVLKTPYYCKVKHVNTSYYEIIRSECERTVPKIAKYVYLFYRHLSKLLNISVPKPVFISTQPQDFKLLSEYAIAFTDLSTGLIKYNRVMNVLPAKEVAQTFNHELVHFFFMKAFPGIENCEWASEGLAEFLSINFTSSFFNYSKKIENMQRNLEACKGLFPWSNANSTNCSVHRIAYDRGYFFFSEINCNFTCLRKFWYYPDSCSELSRLLSFCCGPISEKCNELELWNCSTSDRFYYARKYLSNCSWEELSSGYARRVITRALKENNFTALKSLSHFCTRLRLLRKLSVSDKEKLSWYSYAVNTGNAEEALVEVKAIDELRKLLQELENLTCAENISYSRPSEGVERAKVAIKLALKKEEARRNLMGKIKELGFGKFEKEALEYYERCDLEKLEEIYVRALACYELKRKLGFFFALFQLFTGAC